MTEVIEKWLLKSVGIRLFIIPSALGNACFDGTLFAKILLRYKICSPEYLLNISRQDTFADAYANLQQLSIWFKLLHISFDDELLKEIAEKKDSAALHLLYELFLKLEDRENLILVDEMNKNRLLTESTDKFLVSKVAEHRLKPETPNDKKFMIEAIDNGQDIIEMFLKKERHFQEFCLQESRKRRAAIIKELNNDQLINQVKEIRVCNVCSSQGKDLDLFNDIKETNENLLKLKRKTGIRGTLSGKPKEFISFLKDSHRKKEAGRVWREKIVQDILDEAWREIYLKREDDFRDNLSKNLLKQTDCEKEMIIRLRRSRRMYKTFLDNRKVIQEAEQNENRTSRFLESFRIPEEENLKDIENSRIKELHDILKLEKDKIRYEKNYKECSAILKDIVDLAVVSHEYSTALRTKPSKKKVMSWKLMFILGIPLFVCQEGDGNTKKQPIGIEDKHSEILAEFEFHLYNCLIGPWSLRSLRKSQKCRRKCKRRCKPRCKCGCKFREDLIVPKEFRVGNIVHRLLDLKYPYNMSFGKPAEIPQYPIQALLRSVTSPYVINRLKSFLEEVNIAVVDVNTAANYVIDSYNEYQSHKQDEKISVTAQNITNTAIYRSQTINREEQIQLLKTRTFIERMDEMDKYHNAVVQVPEKIKKTIPRKVTLGGIVKRHLSKGLLLSDILSCEIILEYIKSLKNIKGWVLLNFPNNLTQVATIEYLFSGREVPFMQAITDNIYLKLKSEFKFIDEPIPEGKITELQQNYSQAEKLYIRLNRPSMTDITFSKRSNIVQKQNLKSEFFHFKSIFTRVILLEYGRQEQLQEVDDVLEGEEDEFTDDQDENDSYLFSKSVDDFYGGLKILVRFPVKKLNPNTLLSLARVIINEAPNEWYPRWKNDVDLFGFEKLVHIKAGPIVTKDSLAPPPTPNFRDLFKGPVYSRPKLELLTKALYRIKEKRKKEIKEPTEKDEEKPEDSPIIINVGESNSKNYFSKEHYEPLASIWESIEFFYIFNMTESLHRLNLIDSQFIPYRNFVVKKAEECVHLNDDRKRVVSNFQVMLNSVSDNLRQVKSMKNELHYRVRGLQRELWKMSNVKKIFSDDILRRLIKENWLPKQLCNYLKCYVSILQVEVDRFVYTMQFITDYYSVCASERISYQSPRKIFLPKFEYEKNDVRKVAKQKVLPKPSTRQSLKQSMKQTPKPSAKRTSKQAEKNIKDGKQNKIRPLKKNDFDELTVINCASSLDKRCESAINLLRNLINRLRIRTWAINDSYKRFSREMFYSKRGIGSNQQSLIMLDREEPTQAFPSEKDTVYNDWADTLQEESDRLFFRLGLIEAHAKKNMRDQISVIKCSFKYFKLKVLDRFHRERLNIDKLCDLLRVSIEEEVKIQPSIILDGDQFYVDPDKLMYPNPPPPEPRALEETAIGHQMTAFQLTNFHRKMSYVAPLGLLKIMFIHILQEMATLGHELGNPYLPKIWSILEVEVIEELINSWFGNKSVICWKDFIIFALDYTYPSLDEILSMKEQFKAHDPERSELITKDQFMNSILWLDNRRTFGLEQTLRCIKLKELLFELFQVNIKQMNYTCFLLSVCRDENPKVGLIKALAVIDGLLTVTWSGLLYDDEDQENYKYYISKSILQDILKKVYDIEDIKISDTIDENTADLNQFMPKLGRRASRRFSIIPLLIENNEDKSDKSLRIEVSSAVQLDSQADKSPDQLDLRSFFTNFKSSEDFLNYDVHFDTIHSIFIFYFQYYAVSPDHAYQHLALEKNLNRIFSEKGDGYTITLQALLSDEFIEKLLTSYRLFHAINITQYLNLFNKTESAIAEEYEMK